MNQVEPRTWRYMLTALPAIAALCIVLLAGQPATIPGIFLAVLVALLTLAAAHLAISRDRHHERTLLSLLESIRLGQYSIRAKLPSDTNSAQSILGQINTLAAQLQEQQAGEREALSLVRKTLAALDAGVFLFDHRQALKMVNPAGALILGTSGSDLLGRKAEELSLQTLMDCPSGSVQSHEFPRYSGRWQVTRATLRSEGMPAQLLVIQLVEPLLRKEQAHAFSQLLRVISHEINNSLAPISSMALSARELLPSTGQALSDEKLEDIRESLVVIGRRSESLQNFIGHYAALARIPPPQIEVVPLGEIVSTSLALFPREKIIINGADSVLVAADRDQLEQVLINLVRNSLQSPGVTQVKVCWHEISDGVVIRVVDDGAGIPATSNLFVPFFTTKKGGSGIGLALSRHIINTHGGELTLENRPDGQGAVARIELRALCEAGQVET